tara:strand:+ start:5609 stop:6325 length:717 start_codon:yes stop_codon:yes gene_type:complete
MLNINLQQNAHRICRDYYNKIPFPHIVLDNFLDPVVMDSAADEAEIFSNQYRAYNRESNHDDQIGKFGISDAADLPPVTRVISKYVNSPNFLSFLRTITNMPSLVGDDSYTGGGLHFTRRGGFLGVHHDFNFTGNSANPEFYRKVNIIIFLNKRWDKDWGGDLELWDKELTKPYHSVEAIFNRAVIFNIEDAPHGHPHPLNCPEHETRRTLAYYFYDKIPVTNRLYDRAHWKHGQTLV